MLVLCVLFGYGVLSRANRIVNRGRGGQGRGNDLSIPYAEKVCTLNASGSIARQHLLEDIMLHFLPQMSLARLSCNYKWAIRKLKAMPLNPSRYMQVDRIVHFL